MPRRYDIRYCNSTDLASRMLSTRIPNPKAVSAFVRSLTAATQCFVVLKEWHNYIYVCLTLYNYLKQTLAPGDGGGHDQGSETGSSEPAAGFETVGLKPEVDRAITSSRSISGWLMVRTEQWSSLGGRVVGGWEGVRKYINNYRHLRNNLKITATFAVN